MSAPTKMTNGDIHQKARDIAEQALDVARRGHRGNRRLANLAPAAEHYLLTGEDDPFLREDVLDAIRGNLPWLDAYDEAHGVDDGASDAAVRCPMYAALSDALGEAFHGGAA